MRPTASRRRFLGLSAAGLTVGLAGCVGTDDGQDATDRTTTGATTTADVGGTATTTRTTTDGTFPDAVALEPLATGFEVPLDVEFATVADRRYVAEQGGRIFVHESGGLRDAPFLDLRDTVATGREMGLLGVALHPDFAQNRRVFVRYSAPPREGTPDGYSHTFVLAEFEATADGTRAKRDSERTILEIPEPQPNHNAGSLAFGPDGYLYVGVGDGGSGGDQGQGHVGDWYDAVGGGNGQDVTENLLGSVLRIDVDGETPANRNYSIPEDNPFAGDGPGLPEHYAWGFRNPWRMAFDRGDLLVADVGQSAYEEVDVVEKGGNYGWNVTEASHCFRADDCPDRAPESVRGGEPLRDPVIQYSHSGGEVTGRSVIGGQIYRGSALSRLRGTYLFADLAAQGRLFAATPTGRERGRTAEGDATAGETTTGDATTSDATIGDTTTGGAAGNTGLWPIQVVEVDGGAERLQRVYSFGRDADGEVYVLGEGSEGGAFYRVVPTA